MTRFARPIAIAVTLAAGCQGTIGGGREGPTDTPGLAADGTREAMEGNEGSGGEVFVPPDLLTENCPYIAEHRYARPSDPFFEPTQVIRIDLEMTPVDWQYQLDNPDLEEYRPVTVSFCGLRAEGAGMRFKRSTHPSSDLPEGEPKNPMVLDINRFNPGQKLLGLRKINLEYGGDQRLVAERMNWELLAAFDRDVARVNHAELYLSGDYLGVFTNVERVDRSYANHHWGDNDGQLYKHAYCGTFTWQGSDASNYTGDPRCYAPKPSDSTTDYADIIRVIDLLNNTPGDELQEVFPTIWDVDEWIPTIAALQVIGYGDTPNANANNFYTYYPPDGGPTRFALWDLDAGYWGTDAPCEHPADIIGWDLFRTSSCYNDLPLFDRTMDVPSWRQRYLDAAAEFLAGPFDPNTFTARVDEIVALLEGPLADDPNRFGDDTQWHDAIDELKSRQSQRASNVRQQLLDHGVDL